MLTCNENTNIPPHKNNPLHWGNLERDEMTNETYLQPTFTVVLKCKREMLYVPLEIEKNITIDAPVDFGAYVSTIAQNSLDRTKQQAMSNILKMDNPPNFHMKASNGQIEKALATATLKVGIGDSTFADHFVILKNITGLIIGSHFMRNNSVVVDTTHCFIHFPQLTMQVKTDSSETSDKCKAPTCCHWRCPDNTAKDNGKNHSFSWPSFLKE